MKKEIKFPKNFFWGAATASHQAEGNNHNNWSEWEKSKKRIDFLHSRGLTKKYGLENFISGKAADHYNRFQEDFKLAKDLGHNATRFSIEWSRVEPREGYFDKKEIEHYRQVVASLRRLGIEPFVSLWHWTIPLWLKNKGGWQYGKISDCFVSYAKKMSSSFGKDIRFWITLNEPEVYAVNSYLIGVWPPQKKNLFTYLRALRNLVKAHREAYQIIKKNDPESKIGIAKNNTYFEAHKDRAINKIFKKVIDCWWNFYFLNQIKNHQDFIGLNHYFYNRINFGFNKNKDETEKVSDMGWGLYPEAIYFVLKDLKKFNKPIYITENGLADARDKKRGWFIFESLKNIHRAIEEGVDVRGYLHWSLMDNFEWDKGFWPRFGLLGVDYKTLERKIRPSAKFYRDICMANGITGKILKSHQKLIN